MPGTDGNRYRRRAHAGSSPTASDDSVVHPARAGSAHRRGTGSGGAITTRAAARASAVSRRRGRIAAK
jgi:hypothetical protein